MGCQRDPVLLDCYVSGGAKAEEVRGVGTGDIHWAKPGLYVITKGTRDRELVPISPEACVRLARYPDSVGTPEVGEPVWRTRHGEHHPVRPDHSVMGRHSASRSTTSRQARCAC